MVAQPAATPYFAPDPHVSRPARPQSPPADETLATGLRAGRTGRQERPPVGETTPPEATAPTRAPHIETSDPRYSERPSPSQAQTNFIAAAHEEESRPAEVVGSSESRPEPISDPRRDPEQASPPAVSHAEEASPSSSTSGSEVEAGSAKLSTPVRVVARTREVSRLEETTSGRPDVSVSDAKSSEHPSDSQALSQSRLAPVRPAERSQTSPGAFDESETFPGETPAIIQPPPIIEQASERSRVATVSERTDATPPVQVRIGTVEVRAVTPPTTPPPDPRPAAPAPGGFDDYAMIRSYVSWERR
jgi:hypothetical protein